MSKKLLITIDKEKLDELLQTAQKYRKIEKIISNRYGWDVFNIIDNIIKVVEGDGINN